MIVDRVDESGYLLILVNNGIPGGSPPRDGDGEGGDPTLFRPCFSKFFSALGRIFQIFRPL